MPFVRFVRDRRGYEQISLVEAPAGRGKTSRPLLLYWYRTPSGVKVGRDPFDPETRRVLQRHYPEIAFDWDKIASAPKPPALERESWCERRRTLREARSSDVLEEVRQSGDEWVSHEEMGDASPPQFPEASSVADVHSDPDDSAGTPGQTPLNDGLGQTPQNEGVETSPAAQRKGGRRRRRRRRKGQTGAGGSNS